MWNYTGNIGELDIIANSGTGTGGVNLYAINTNTPSYATQTPELAFSALVSACSTPKAFFAASDTNTYTQIGTTINGWGGAAFASTGGTALTGQTKLLISNNATGNAQDTGQLIINGYTDPRKRLGIMLDTTNNVGIISVNQSNITEFPLSLSPGGGRVGVGTYTPAHALDVNGNIGINGVINTTYGNLPGFGTNSIGYTYNPGYSGPSNTTNLTVNNNKVTYTLFTQTVTGSGVYLVCMHGGYQCVTGGNVNRVLLYCTITNNAARGHTTTSSYGALSGQIYGISSSFVQYFSGTVTFSCILEVFFISGAYRGWSTDSDFTITRIA
jgi:hypothetical protein